MSSHLHPVPITDHRSPITSLHLVRCYELARHGEGAVEPNPMVGAVIVRDGVVVGEGWHQQFGGPHAEVHALAQAGKAARGATLYVSLEPCCHHGKTPPCTEAVIAAGITRVVCGMRDPFPAVDGGGIAQLRAAGIACEVADDPVARDLVAPYLKLLTAKLPWVIAKWAMSRDGRMATPPGESPWITGEAARAHAHQQRGKLDAIIIGAGTLVADDPLLTARPPGVRTPLRVVVASNREIPTARRLFQTIAEAPVLIATPQDFPAEGRLRLSALGAEVLVTPATSRAEVLPELLAELGRRRLTNVLIEGGAQLLSDAFAQSLVDEVQVYVAPRVIGGATALATFADIELLRLQNVTREQLADDHFFIRGRLIR
jgi:diaminohydroxyphosphoribosylaminopyrimidine deaminase / 5-amino-6-(5-phosphoribosylamino)uracil reductase